MFIREWMTRDIQTVTPDTPMMTAARLMKSHRVRRLPVVDDQDRLVGIVTDRDIKEASPSKATTLDTRELYYLLSEIKVHEVMSRDPVALRPDDTLGQAIVIMGELRYSGLPVVDDDNKVVGVISYSDVFRVITGILGIKHGGLRIIMELPEEPAVLPEVLRVLINRGARISTVLALPEEGGTTAGKKFFMRLRLSDDADLDRIIESIEAVGKVLFWGEDKPAQDTNYQQ